MRKWFLKKDKNSRRWGIHFRGLTVIIKISFCFNVDICTACPGFLLLVVKNCPAIPETYNGNFLIQYWTSPFHEFCWDRICSKIKSLRIFLTGHLLFRLKFACYPYYRSLFRCSKGWKKILCSAHKWCQSILILLLVSLSSLLAWKVCQYSP